MLDGMLKYTLQTYLGQRHPGFLMRINGRVSQFPFCFHVFSRVSVADFQVDEAPKSLKGAVTKVILSLHGSCEHSWPWVTKIEL